MKGFINFSERQKNEAAIRKTWEGFRSALSKGEFEYNEVDKAKSNTFLKVFDDLFNKSKGFELLEKRLGYIDDFEMGRGTKLSNDEVVTYERFLPQKEYIKSDNRFSPANVEWLYLALGTENSVIECAKKECRMTTGDRFGFCKFETLEEFKEKKIVDLTIANEVDFDDINQEFGDFTKKYIKEKAEKSLQTGIYQGVDMAEIFKPLIKWTVYTYAKLLSSQIFTPITTTDKQLEYAPFQTIANYFLSLNYVGIIYESTVYPEGKNIVLFDKQIAYPKDEILDIIL